MLRPNLRSNSRNVNTAVPGPRWVDVSSAISDAGCDATESPGIPTIQHSDLRGLQFPQLRDTFNRRVDNDQDHWYKIQSQIEKDAPSLDNGIESKLKIFQAVFLELSDKSCMQKIYTHFILEKYHIIELHLEKN